jgi:hypothetical protein
MAVACKSQRMARPKQEVTKEARVDVRMHAVLRDALERVARREGRTMSQWSERVLRQAVIDALRTAGDSVRDVENLP